MSEPLAFRVRVLDEVASTNDEVKRALEAGEPEGLVVRARRQVAGYGRQGRAWTSPEGGLYCSLLLRPAVEPAALPTLSLVAGIAVRRALVSLADAPVAETVQIKWPNDVVVARCGAAPPSASPGVPAFLKLCGISCEAHARGVCVGVGVNVAKPSEPPAVGGKNEPAYVVDLAPGLAALPVPAALDAVFDAFVQAFAPLYDAWQRDGFAPLLDEYNSHASLAGLPVRVEDLGGRQLGAGAVEGVDVGGRLVLRGPDGATLLVSSGEAHIA